jgi:hypothetical protein
VHVPITLSLLLLLKPLLLLLFLLLLLLLLSLQGGFAKTRLTAPPTNVHAAMKITTMRYSPGRSLQTLKRMGPMPDACTDRTSAVFISAQKVTRISAVSKET